MKENKQNIKEELSDKIKETVIEFLEEQDLEDTEGGWVSVSNVEVTF